jgi:hypothetical protein
VIDRPLCRCLEPQNKRRGWREPRIHAESQDMTVDAWKRLLDLIDLAAEDGREAFSPSTELGWDDWWQIVTLPPTIAKLKAVKVLDLYASGLVRVPPEIGEMDSLVEFDPYTSYRLHSLPFEITRCKNLAESRISTRALYGNYKFRPPFPKLPQAVELLAPKRCSVCGEPFGSFIPIQTWISARTATDVMPLLVHACSAACLDRLPRAADGYVAGPHEGGLGVVQPEPRF